MNKINNKNPIETDFIKNAQASHPGEAEGW